MKNVVLIGWSHLIHLSRLSPRATYKAEGSGTAKGASQMQACLRSSLSNSGSKDGDLEFMWFGNFFSHC